MKSSKTVIRLIHILLVIQMLLLFTYSKCPKPIRDFNPIIYVNTNSISFFGFESGPNPSSQVLQVKNGGVETLEYTVYCQPDWLSVYPTSGSSMGNVYEHTVSVEISGLFEGEYRGDITIFDDNAKNSPVTISVTLYMYRGDNISLYCNPESGSTDSTATVILAISGNINEISAFGLELVYDTTMFEYQSVTAGELTQNWAAVDGYEISPGIARIGGFAGGGEPVSQYSIGNLVKVRLKVTCIGCVDGQQSQISIQNLTDDIVVLVPYPAYVIFTYKE